MAIDFSKYIASVKDFPNKGIVFRDITPILQDGDLYRTATHELAEYAKSRNADVIVGPEARGFIVGCPVATELGIGFVPARNVSKFVGNSFLVPNLIRFDCVVHQAKQLFHQICRNL